jgi:ribosomal-protein-alanine N-acetyltransferase
MARRHPFNVERQVVLTTQGIVVTTWLPDDVEDLYELHSDPLTMRFVGPGRPESREECVRRLGSYLHEQRLRGWTKWRVQTMEGAMIGRAGFGPYGPNRELGYVLRPDAQEHAASRRVLEKVGFDFIDRREHNGSMCAFYVSGDESRCCDELPLMPN